MGLRTPASWIQGGSHTAENDRLTERAEILAAGTIGTADFAVAAHGTPNMSVDVAAGAAYIKGSITATQGYYKAVSDATVNVAVTAADATNPRIDLVCLTVRDAQYAGSNNDVILQVVAGTPAATPAVPSAPANSYILAQIAVAANATSITNGNITDKRARVRRGSLTLQAASSSDPILTLFDESSNNVGGIDHLGNLTAPNLPSGWTTYTPTWTAFGGSPTQPSVGSGSITGRYFISGGVGAGNRVVHVIVTLTLGSTSTVGSGGQFYAFSLPITPSDGAAGSWINNGPNGNVAGICYWDGANWTIYGLYGQASLANGNSVRACMTYRG